MNEKQERMLAQAKKEHKHISMEQGIACPTCAEMSDPEYDWIELVEQGNCYNCGMAWNTDAT